MLEKASDTQGEKLQSANQEKSMITENMNAFETYSKREVAKLIGCSEMSIHRLIRDKKLGYYRIGSRVFVSRRHIEEFLRRCERKPRTAMTA